MNDEYLAKKGITSEKLEAIATIIWNGLSPNDLGLEPKQYNNMNEALTKCVEKLREKERKIR